MGIDEAGRGCVLGDLVIGAFAADDPDDLTLRTAGAADSKALDHPKRLAARAKLAGLGTVAIRRVSARQIDAGNLNALEETAIVELVKELRPDLVHVDALGHPSALPAIEKRLRKQMPRGLRPEWNICPKADVTYAVVGAASIFAKTLRDELIEAWRHDFGDFGSGYPSDPKTKEWLATWARAGAPWPEFVRTRWSTVSALAQGSLL